MTHLRHHGRFYVAAMIGGIVFVVAWAWGHEWPLSFLLAGDVFFATYLVLMLRLALGTTHEGLRQRATFEDEGLFLIFGLTAVAVIFSLAAIFMLINQPHRQTPVLALLAVASVPVSWAMIHTLAAFHYANLFYHPTRAAADAVAGGLSFPATPRPGILDFAYFSFVIGMTAQVSDVVVESRPMRQAALLHGIVSFFYNAVLIAIAVNAAINLAGAPSP